MQNYGVTLSEKGNHLVDQEYEDVIVWSCSLVSKDSVLDGN